MKESKGFGVFLNWNENGYVVRKSRPDTIKRISSKSASRSR